MIKEIKQNKKKTFGMLCTALLLSLIVFASLYAIVPVVRASWWDTNWNNYKVLPITNPCNDCQIFINVTNNTGGDVGCGQHCQSDFDDIRFIGLDNVTVLPYWCEKYVDNSYAWFWVNLTSDVEVDGAILMYYNNSDASSLSDAYTTFWQFIDYNSVASWEQNITYPYMTVTSTGSQFRFLKTTTGTGKSGILSYNFTSSFPEYYNIQFRFNVSNYGAVDYMVALVSGWDKWTVNISAGVSHGPYSQTDWNYRKEDPPNSWFATMAPFVENTYYIEQIKVDTTDVAAGVDYYFRNGSTRSVIVQNTSISFGLGTDVCNTAFVMAVGSSNQLLSFFDWIFVGKTAATDPTWGTVGSEITREDVSVFSVDGFISGRVTWAGNPGDTAIQLETVDIYINANASTNVSEVRIWVGDMNDTGETIGATNLSLYISSDNSNYGLMGVFVDGGSNITVNHTTWNAGTMGADPFTYLGIIDRIEHIYFRLYLTIPATVSEAKTFYNTHNWYVYIGYT